MAFSFILWPDQSYILWPDNSNILWTGGLSTVYFGLSTTQPTSVVTEPTWTGYSRVLQDLTTWTAIEAGSIFVNNAAFSFPIVNTGLNTYYDIPYFVVFDAFGTVLDFGSVNPQITVGTGDTITFNPGQFILDVDVEVFTPDTSSNASASVAHTPLVPTYAPAVFSTPILYGRNMRS